MRSARRNRSAPESDGSSWTTVAVTTEGSSWTRQADSPGSSRTRTASFLRGSSWTRTAAPERGSSWTSQAQPVRGSSWTRVLPRTVIAGLAALAVGAAGSPAYAATTQSSSGSPSRPAAGTTSDRTWLVRTDAAHLDAVKLAVVRLGGSVMRTMAAVGIVQVRLPAGRAAALGKLAGVAGISPDGAVKLATDSYNPATDALSATTQAAGIRGATGYAATGRGVDVALVDSGVAPVKGLNGADKVIYGPDLSFESQNPNTRYLDTFGHGTHLAGIIAGHDPGVDASTVGPTDPAFLGVAPDARILSVKVADSHGNSDVSQVIAGVDWVVQHAQDSAAGLNVRVLNLSFGTDADVSYLRDPLSQAVEVAWHRGIVVVVSAGNRGSSLGHLTDPAIDPYVIAAAAGDNQGGVAAFSSIGDGVRNPDITAPGVHVPSLRVPGSYIDVTYGAAAGADDRFLRGSGTSQAAAYVSGLVADMIQANPSLTPDKAKYLLRATATPLNASSAAAGAGLVSGKALDPNAVPSADRPLPAATAVAAASASSTATVGATGGTLQSSFSSDSVAATNDNERQDSRSTGGITQRFARSSGRGPLEKSRGTYHLTNNQVVLAGEQDIFGHAWDSRALAKNRKDGESWTEGGVYNGLTWTGSAWGGSAWGSSAWAGSAWGGSAWGGSAWGGSAWGSGVWDGSAWGGSAWGGSAWGGSAWGGSAWGGSAWGGSAWGGSAWGSSAWGSSLWG